MLLTAPHRCLHHEDDLAAGAAELALLEPRFVPILAAAGALPLRQAEPGFHGLARVVVSQQLSVASARAIWARVEAGFPGLDPGAIRAADDADLRACGLSGPKMRTLRALAAAVADGLLDFAALEQAETGEVHERLTAVHGIGPWTADIYLLFHLRRADAFACGDLALQEAARIGFELAARPTARELAAMAEAWSPWRGVAARSLWAYYNAMKTREGIAV